MALPYQSNDIQTGRATDCGGKVRDIDSRGLQLQTGPFPAHFQILAHNPDGKEADIKKRYTLI